MEQLMLYPTETSQWQALVNEAEVSAETELGEDLESYLVFLLMRYISNPDLYSKSLAVDFLNGQVAIGKQHQFILRDVGDKCLLFSGLFPGVAERRQLKISYYVDLGRVAYHTLAHLPNNTLADLFASLHKSFISIMDVLQAMRALAADSQQLQPIQALDLWIDTGSKQALHALRSYTHGIPLQTIQSKKSS